MPEALSPTEIAGVLASHYSYCKTHISPSKWLWSIRLADRCYLVHKKYVYALYTCIQYLYFYNYFNTIGFVCNPMCSILCL